MGVNSKMSVCLSVVYLSACRLSSVCLSVCLSVVPNYFWSVGLIGIIFFTKTRENVYVEILILEFRGQHPSAKSTLAHNFCPFKKIYIYFYKDKFTLQSIILAEFWIFSLGNKFGLIQEKTNNVKK